MHNNIENKTVFIASNVIELEEVRSTNAYAAQLLNSKNVAEGTVIVANSQTEGKGQQGNRWISEPGKNITLSLILYPAFLDVNEQFYLTKFVTLGLLDFLSKYISVGLSIKWPNDIYHNQSKLAGILIENSIQGSRIKHCIIGIGLNIHQENFDESLPNPTSLSLISEKEYDMAKLYRVLFKCLEARYLQLRSGKFKIIDEQYHQQLYRLNKISRYLINGKEVEASMLGVTKSGLLKILSGNTCTEHVMKEITFL